MKIITSIADFQHFRKSISTSLGFVPTMGALHKGHLSLIKSSINKCSLTVVSIFVNPGQFAPGEDLKNYPISTKKDIKFLQELKVDALFLPTTKDIYPEDFSTFVYENIVSKEHEGISRPSFFKGVITIVVKLFNIIYPTHAFFGEKDIQQLMVIKKIVKDLNYPVDIVSCPTVREKNGLAMSSRNQYLSSKMFNEASLVYRSLNHGLSLLKNGENNPKIIINAILNSLSESSLIKVDYISIVDPKHLKNINKIINSDIIICIAVYCGKVRLIDNVMYINRKY